MKLRYRYACIFVLATIFVPTDVLSQNQGQARTSWAGPDFIATFTSLPCDVQPSDVGTLDTWKTGVKGTIYGEQLMSMLEEDTAALQSNSVDTAALYRRAYLYGMIGCTKSAIADLSKAVMADSTSAKLYCERAICYMDELEYGLALQDLNHAVRLNPHLGEARLARGRLFLLLNNVQLALADLIAASSEDVEYKPLLPGELAANVYGAPNYYLGCCYEVLGRRNEAIELFSGLPKSDSNSSGYLHRYADKPPDCSERLTRLENHWTG